MQKFKNYIPFFSFVFICWACHQRPKKEDSFYANKGEWDDVEIPVLKPYQLIKLNGFKEWGMNLENASMLGDVQAVNVLQGFVFAYSKKTIYKFQGTETTVWSIMNPAKKFEKTFNNYSDYKRCVRECGFKYLPVLYIVDDIAAYSEKNDVINWEDINKELNKK